jgi:hypothetical protein
LLDAEVFAIRLENFGELIVKFRVEAKFALERIRKELSFGKVCTSVVFIDAFENID